MVTLYSKKMLISTKAQSLCKQCLHDLHFMKKDPPRQTSSQFMKTISLCRAVYSMNKFWIYACFHVQLDQKIFGGIQERSGRERRRINCNLWLQWHAFIRLMIGRVTAQSLVTLVSCQKKARNEKKIVKPGQVNALSYSAGETVLAKAVRPSGSSVF